MSDHTSGCLDDARELLWGHPKSVASQAPDLGQCENGITPFDCPREYESDGCVWSPSPRTSAASSSCSTGRQECEEPRCLTLKTDHLLKLEVHSHEPCDSELATPPAVVRLNAAV
jgi:hypothetical protein